VFGSQVFETWDKREEDHCNYECAWCWSVWSHARSPNASSIEWTHIGSGGAHAGSCSMDSSGGRWVGEGGFSSSLSSFEEETRIGTKDGTNSKDGSQDEDDTNNELGSHDKTFSSNLTSLLLNISFEWNWRSR